MPLTRLCRGNYVLQPLLPGCQQAERDFREAAAACNQHRGGQRSGVHIGMSIKNCQEGTRPKPRVHSKREKKHKIINMAPLSSLL